MNLCSLVPVSSLALCLVQMPLILCPILNEEISHRWRGLTGISRSGQQRVGGLRSVPFCGASSTRHNPLTSRQPHKQGQSSAGQQAPPQNAGPQVDLESRGKEVRQLRADLEAAAAEGQAWQGRAQEAVAAQRAMQVPCATPRLSENSPAVSGRGSMTCCSARPGLHCSSGPPWPR